jgi:hypothetical protein
MSSNAHATTDTPTDGDIATHDARFLKDCALCGAVESTATVGSECNKCARIWLEPAVQASWVVYYCSKGCQKKTWPATKRVARKRERP